MVLSPRTERCDLSTKGTVVDRKLAAILAADVVGYSRLMEEDEQGTFERLRAGRKELFEPEIARHHGRIFKLMGDGLLAEFSSVVDAVECAVALQKGLAARNASVSEDQCFKVRIGVNLGEVIVEGDDCYGEGVNIAARLEQLAEPGGIYVSGKVAKEVEKKLAFGFEAMGEQRVKNIVEPIAVYRVKLDGLPRGRIVRRSDTGRARWIVAAASAVALVLVAGAVLAVPGWWKSTGPLAEKPSIAVLTLDSLGDDPKWERIADGMTEDIITDLSHSRELTVIARNSSAVYKGKAVDIRKVGEELGVRYVLEGSLQPIGDRIRVTAQLIDAASGSHVWSERYDQPAADIFAVQSEVTERIAVSLAGYGGAIAGAELQLIKRKPPNGLTGYDTYLLGMEAKHQVTKESLIEAERLFRKAIDLDPQLARAYVGLTYVYAYMLILGLAESPEEIVSKHLEAAQKAVEIDPNDGETHLVLGTANIYRGKREQALAEFAKAEALAPNNADILVLIAWNIPGMGEGESQRAVRLADRAVALNPHYPDWYNQALYYAYFYGEQFEKSKNCTKLVKNPFAPDYAYLAISYAYLGRAEEAKAAATEAAKLDPKWIAEQYLSDTGGVEEREANLFVEGARKAGLAACVSATELKSIPNLIRVKSCDEERVKAASG
jgi:TolB-like protein/class 3 adenylate cyclase/tetratricopeptide (TPR) repeat protein